MTSGSLGQGSTYDPRQTLETFLSLFSEYSDEIFGEHDHNRLESLRAKLQRLEPKITRLLSDILGEGAIDVGSFGRSAIVQHRDLLPTALLGGNNEEKHNFYDFKGPVTARLTRALGAIEAGLWPRSETKPVLNIQDAVLRTRRLDLLTAPSSYDRVIREATTVLEDRLRNKPPHRVLARLIPQAADQTGDNLANRLLSPRDPVIVVSEEKNKQVAFFHMTQAVFSYLRNPYHHRIDSSTEWSWAWATVGLIDRLLSEIDLASINESQTG